MTTFPVQEVQIPVDGLLLNGELTLPPQAKGLVVFAHGSGSSRFSPRNRQVAGWLQQRGFGTLLFDLLTEEEDSSPENRFDIPLLADRLIGVTNWLEQQEPINHLKVGFFGASTGAAAALQAAAALPVVKAMVSRGGRPDLVLHTLPFVQAAVLLIVGSKDTEVLELNEAAFRQLNNIRELDIIDGATHLFEEPGTLEQAGRAAGRWFEQHLTGHT